MNYDPNTNLPEALYHALIDNEYSRGESKYSATDLISPPQIVQLTRRHSDEITINPTSNFHSMLGSAIHDLLDRKSKQLNLPHEIAEQRLIQEVLGIPISGEPDVFCTLEDGQIDDYKLVKVDALYFFPKVEHEQQLNIYSFFRRMNGDKVSRLRIIALLKDWSEVKVGTKKEYPSEPIKIYNIPLWSEEQAIQFIEERIKIHEAAELLPDDQLFECTDEERWRKWLVREKGTSKIKKFSSRKLAAEFIDANPDKKYIMKPDIALRCSIYCRVSKYCQQLKREVQ
jgi:hypothetical protein